MALKSLHLRKKLIYSLQEEILHTKSSPQTTWIDCGIPRRFSSIMALNQHVLNTTPILSNSIYKNSRRASSYIHIYIFKKKWSSQLLLWGTTCIWHHVIVFIISCSSSITKSVKRIESYKICNKYRKLELNPTLQSPQGIYIN